MLSVVVVVVVVACVSVSVDGRMGWAKWLRSEKKGPSEEEGRK